MFILTCLTQGATALSGVTASIAQKLGANNYTLVTSGEIWRLITHMFLHGSLIHIVLNMYSLYILGSQLETFIGKAKFINSDFIKDNAVVIDIGINRDENDKLCGDVDFENVKDKVSFITPVPGGVGPMTIAMLMNNCVKNKFNKYIK